MVIIYRKKKPKSVCNTLTKQGHAGTNLMPHVSCQVSYTKNKCQASCADHSPKTESKAEDKNKPPCQILLKTKQIPRETGYDNIKMCLGNALSSKIMKLNSLQGLKAEIGPIITII